MSPERFVKGESERTHAATSFSIFSVFSNSSVLVPNAWKIRRGLDCQAAICCV
jgi:hypothetical protein